MRAIHEPRTAGPYERIDTPLVSIVIPVFCGEHTIGPLVDELIACLAATWRLEIVLVNDGSPDNSGEACRAATMSPASASIFLLSISGFSA